MWGWSLGGNVRRLGSGEGIGLVPFSFARFGYDDAAFVAFNETTVIGKQQRGERQGDNQADKSQQRPPDRKGQQDDSRVQPHHLAHDLRHEERVLDALHHDEHYARAQNNEPEALARLIGFQQSEKHGRDDTNHLHIGNQVQHPDEHAQGYGQRKVDNQETDAEQDADDESHQGLPPEIRVHPVLHVAGQRGGKAAASGSPLFVAKFNKTDVKYHDGLKQAVSRAIEKKPGVMFEVVAVSPSNGNVLAQTSAKNNASRIFQDMIDMGVGPERITLSSKTSSAANSAEVQIFVK